MSDAPERVWLGRDTRYVGGPWIRLASQFEDDESGDDVAEYVRLDLHTAALSERDARIAALEAGLGKLLHAVCGPTGFAECVRLDTNTAYPWPALDDAEAEARALLDGGKP